MRSITRQVLLPTQSALIRSFRTSTPLCVESTSLSFSSFGNPSSVLRSEKKNIDEKNIPFTGVLVKMLAASVTPRDVAAIRGSFSQQQTQQEGQSRVGGSQGVGEVVVVGEQVKSVKTGDRIFVSSGTTGTWSTHILLESSDVCQVPSSLSLSRALQIGSITAIRDLFKQIGLNSGDQIIHVPRDQASARSVESVAKAMGVKVSVLDPKKPAKTSAKVVLLGTTGEAAENVLRQLEDGSTAVVYGGSWQPLRITASSLMLKKIRVIGANFDGKLPSTVDDFVASIDEQPVEWVSIDQFNSAFEKDSVAFKF